MNISRETAGNLISAGALVIAIGGPVAYAGYELGHVANNVTPAEVSAANNTLQAGIGDYLSTAKGEDCTKNVLARVLHTSGVYRPLPQPTEISTAIQKGCSQPNVDNLGNEASVKLHAVQQESRTYHQLLRDSDYSAEEKIAYALFGFIGGIVGAASLVALVEVHTY